MVLWTRSGVLPYPRVAVIAGKRTFVRSCDRSRAKRMLREGFRLNRFRFRSDCDYVLVARKRLAEASLAEIERELVRLVRRAGLFAGDGGAARSVSGEGNS